MKKRELKELIEQGEGYFVEFKEQIGVSLDKEMVAFANASGGKIVIGVTDRGKIIGCTTDNTVRSKVQDITNNCDPRILIHVEAYDDSVEITNPGRLLFDSSKFGKLSVARNPILFDAFHRLGITEKIGSGINRMRQAMAARNIEVEFDTGDFFIVTLARPESTRKEVTDQVTDQVKKLLRALKTGEKSGKELIEELKLKHKPTFRMNYLKPAIEAGLIELTIPEKPKSRFQKYRLTKKGHEILRIKTGK